MELCVQWARVPVARWRLYTYKCQRYICAMRFPPLVRVFFDAIHLFHNAQIHLRMCIEFDSILLHLCAYRNAPSILNMGIEVDGTHQQNGRRQRWRQWMAMNTNLTQHRNGWLLAPTMCGRSAREMYRWATRKECHACAVDRGQCYRSCNRIGPLTKAMSTPSKCDRSSFIWAIGRATVVCHVRYGS